MSIERLSNHWSWGLVSGVALLLVLFGPMFANDLLNSQAMGTTIGAALRETGIKFGAPYLFFSCAAGVVFAVNLVWDYCHRHNTNA